VKDGLRETEFTKVEGMTQDRRKRFITLQTGDVEQRSPGAIVNFKVGKNQGAKPSQRRAANANTTLKMRQSARQQPVTQWRASDKDWREDEQRQKHNECRQQAPFPFVSSWCDQCPAGYDARSKLHGVHPAMDLLGRTRNATE